MFKNNPRKIIIYWQKIKKKIPTNFNNEELIPNLKVGLPDGTVVKYPLPMQEMQETWVQSLGQEDPLEYKMATHSSVLALKIPDRGAWRATAYKVTKSGT